MKANELRMTAAPCHPEPRSGEGSALKQILRLRLRMTVGILLFALMIAGCRKASAPALDSSPARVSLPVVSVVRATLPDVITVQGVVSALPDHSIKISPVISGKIARVLVTMGQRAAKGQILAELDNRQLLSQAKQAEAAFQAAAADLSLAAQTLARERLLFQEKIAPKKDLIIAQNQVETARARKNEAAAARDQAFTQLALTNLRSPISGMVARRFLNIGDSTDPSTPVLQVVDLSTVLINASLPADSRVTVYPGNSAQAVTPAYPQDVFAGSVIAVSPVVDPASNAVMAQIRFPNPALKLKEGLAATVSITADWRRKVLTIPKSALAPDPANSKGSMVYVVQGDKIQRVPVRAGVEWHDRVEILEGLHEGDRVVAAGAYGLPDGTLITEVAKTPQLDAGMKRPVAGDERRGNTVAHGPKGIHGAKNRGPWPGVVP